MPKPGMKENTMFISRTIASPKDLIGAGLKSCRVEVEVFLVWLLSGVLRLEVVFDVVFVLFVSFVEFVELEVFEVLF